LVQNVAKTNKTTLKTTATNAKLIKPVTVIFQAHLSSLISATYFTMPENQGGNTF
jgi:hypothetical protein